MRQLLTRAGARVILCDQAWHATAAGLGRAVLVDAAGLAASGPAAPPPVTADPEDLAYVIYTSGSTGQPKAVAVRHRDVTALAADHRFRDGAHHRVLLHSPLAFDASTYELWVPLLSGGQVVIAPPGDLDPATLRRMITEHQVTGLWLTSGAVPGDRPGRAGLPGRRTRGMDRRGRRARRRGPPGARRLPRPDRRRRLRPDRDHHVRHLLPHAGAGRRARRGADRRGRSTTPGSTSWTPGCARSRPASPASSTSPAPAWPAATSNRPA